MLLSLFNHLDTNVIGLISVKTNAQYLGNTSSSVFLSKNRACKRSIKDFFGKKKEVYFRPSGECTKNVNVIKLD